VKIELGSQGAQPTPERVRKKLLRDLGRVGRVRRREGSISVEGGEVTDAADELVLTAPKITSPAPIATAGAHPRACDRIVDDPDSGAGSTTSRVVTA